MLPCTGLPSVVYRAVRSLTRKSAKQHYHHELSGTFFVDRPVQEVLLDNWQQVFNIVFVTTCALIFFLTFRTSLL